MEFDEAEENLRYSLHGFYQGIDSAKYVFLPQGGVRTRERAAGKHGPHDECPGD